MADPIFIFANRWWLTPISSMAPFSPFLFLTPRYACYTTGMLQILYPTAYLLLLLVMLLRPLGFVGSEYFGMERNWMHEVGYLSILSPLPLPFRDNRGYENYVMRREFTFTHPNGTTETVADRVLYDTLRGPHRHKIALVSAVSWAPRLSRSLTTPVYEQILCTETRYEAAKHITIDYINRRDNTRQWSTTHVCTQY